ncbi:MAG: zinc-ribbon domain-containing protein [Methyloceanibacter sp.]
MATLIICPTCETRYETAAVFPPEGRKVRCSKCGHVWQAKAVAQPEAAATGLKVVSKAPGPATPLPPPTPPKAKAKPKPATVNNAMGGFAGIAAAPKAEPSLAERAASAAAVQPDADFSSDEDLAAQVERMNAEAAMAAEGVLPDEKPSRGGIFARLKSKRAPAPAKAPESELPTVPPSETELAALAAGEPPPAEAPSRVVAMGWLGLILFVALILGILVFAKGTVLSVLPGAQRLYGMFGGSSAASGLTFQGVRYGWANEGDQAVLEIQGDVVNSSSSPVAVPQIVIALRDENGNEISEWTTDSGADELAAGEHAAFVRQIPSPPSNVRSVKVRFAKAK